MGCTVFIVLALGRRVPSATVIKDSLFVLDLSLVLQRQRKFSPDTPKLRYIWADSSPMLGRNWIWFQEHSVEVAEVVDLM